MTKSHFLVFSPSVNGKLMFTEKQCRYHSCVWSIVLAGWWYCICAGYHIALDIHCRFQSRWRSAAISSELQQFSSHDAADHADAADTDDILVERLAVYASQYRTACCSLFVEQVLECHCWVDGFVTICAMILISSNTAFLCYLLVHIE